MSASLLPARPVFASPSCRPRLSAPRTGSLGASMQLAVSTLADLRLHERYKGVLLDQFGVLHDGLRPAPGAREAVRALADAGLALLVVSNSSRRSAGALANLGRMGFDASAFAGAVTSGEVTHRHLAERPGDFWRRLGSRCLHLTWGDRGAISLEGLGLQVVQDPTADFDFILAHGTEALGGGDGAPPSRQPLEALTAALAAAARRSPPPPMVVANPDVVTVHGSELRAMPGTLAAEYRRLGGQVVLMGKPAPVIYQAATKLLGLEPSELVAVGDSLEHDIAGAAAAGVDAMFVAGGIHAAELGLSGGDGLGGGEGGGVDGAALAALCRRYGSAGAPLAPRYVVRSFSF